MFSSGAQLQPALQAGAGVLWSLALVAVRQEHHQPAVALPLRFAGGDELVDDDLGAVGEIAELRLPQHQRVGGVQREAPLEAQHCRLGEQAVDQFQRRLVRRQRAQRREALAGAGVIQGGVPLAERAAPAVLAGKADRRPFQQQRPERQRLSQGPEDRLVLVQVLPPRLKQRGEFGMDVEAFGHAHQPVGDLPERRLGHAGLDHRVRVVRSEALPLPLEAVHGRILGRPGADVGQRTLEFLLELAADLLRLSRGQVALHDELLGVDRRQRRPTADLAVHDRLGVGRFVALVVPVPAVAEQVDDDVAVELLAEVERQLGHEDGGLGVLAVDVEDGRLDHLGDVGAVRGRARIGGCGGEADLVVDDDVDSAAGGVPRQLREVQCLGHQALPGKGGVAVDQHGDAALAFGVAEECLLGPRAALDHGIDGFQVRGVGRQRHVELGAARVDAVRGEAEVILDVAVAVHRFGQVLVLELGEDFLVRLAKDVGQDVEPAAMGHAQDDLADAHVGGLLDDGLQDGDERLGAFQREAFLAGIPCVQEALEQLGVVEVLENADLLGPVEGGAIVLRLHARLKPAADGDVLNVHVLHADEPAVGIAQGSYQVVQGSRTQSHERAGIDDAIEVGFRQAELGRLQQRVTGARLAERIEMSEEVANVAIGVDQPDDAGLHRSLGGRRRPGQSQLEALEEETPARIDRSGILPPALVGGFDCFQVEGGGDGSMTHNRRFHTARSGGASHGLRGEASSSI